MKRFLSSLVVVYLCLASLSLAHAQSVFKDLLPRVPGDANALVLIHAKNLRASPVVREFRAKTLVGDSMVDKYVVPRADIERIVLGAELSVALEPQWEVAVVETNVEESLQLLIAQSRGTGEMLGNVEAVLLNTNAYLMKLAPKLYGVYGPANRQKATRWAERSSAASEVALSPYLAKIAEYPETAGTEVMLALDLAGMVDLSLVRANLKNSEVLSKQKNVDQEALARVLASLQGIALGVKATDALNAKLRVDFGRDPAIMKDFAKPLLLEKLGDLGLMIEDFEKWDSSVSGNTVYLSGALSPTGLRKVLSVIDPPTMPARKATATSEIPSASEMDPMAIPSQRYFREINKMLTEMGSNENRKYAKQYRWYDKYARKIDQLSMVNVDPELMDYGLSVSTALRSMAYKLRNQAAEASQYSNNRTTTWNAYGDWYNGYFITYQTEPSERAKAEKMAQMYGTQSLAETVQTVGTVTAETRRKMVERYKIDF